MKVILEGTPPELVAFLTNISDGYNNEILDTISLNVATLLKNNPDPIKMWEALEKRNNGLGRSNRKDK